MRDRAMNLRIRLPLAAALGAPLVGLTPWVFPVGGLSVAVIAGAALGQPQVQPVDAFYAIVTQDHAPLLAGPVETHYRVALLPLGHVVRVDYAIDGWVLVDYPAGATAYVRASEVTLSPDGGTLRTTVVSRLRAANMESTGAGSWATLLADPIEPLAAGTELKVLGVESRADGTAQFYRVAAPDRARGFLRAGLFRKASAQETQDHLNRLAMIGSAGDPQAAPASNSTPSTGPATDPGAGTQRATPPAPEAPAGASPGVNTSLLVEPAVPTGRDTPVGQTPAPLVIDQSGAITGGPSPDAVPPTADPVALTAAGLDLAFEEIRREPVREAEYEELIARFDQFLSTLGSSRDDQRVKRALEARVDLLRLRRDYRDSLLALDEGRRDAKELAGRAAERIDWLRTQGGYAVIGRLVPSTIYDGTSGPLMYRVVAVNTDVPRTLAYIRMDDTFTLPTLVGKIVGVRGQVTIEPSIGTRIVQAESVDAVEVQN